MIFLPAIFNLIFCLQGTGNTNFPKPDPCQENKANITAATFFTKDSLFLAALNNIKTAYKADGNEHCVSIGRDSTGSLIVSAIVNGGAISGMVPKIPNAFSDLHNHPNQMPPDAGDFYGLAAINKKNPNYTTRFALSSDATLYALLVNDAAALHAFTNKYPPQAPAYTGGPPGFPMAFVDEAREMKYQHHCTDEMVMAFMLDKYNTGMVLLKQQQGGNFSKIITIASNDSKGIVYNTFICP